MIEILQGQNDFCPVIIRIKGRGIRADASSGIPHTIGRIHRVALHDEIIETNLIEFLIICFGNRPADLCKDFFVGNRRSLKVGRGRRQGGWRCRQILFLHTIGIKISASVSWKFRISHVVLHQRDRIFLFHPDIGIRGQPLCIAIPGRHGPEFFIRVFCSYVGIKIKLIGATVRLRKLRNAYDQHRHDHGGDP